VAKTVGLGGGVRSPAGKHEAKGSIWIAYPPTYPAASNPSRPCESWSADLAVETAPEGDGDLISRNKESVHQRIKEIVRGS
jgi:hypothetical protein